MPEFAKYVCVTVACTNECVPKFICDGQASCFLSCPGEVAGHCTVRIAFLEMLIGVLI